jgi:UDP-glucose 4-epimerase
MMSRGSVIPLFLEQIKSGNSVTVTNTDMTRFLMSLDESVDLVKYAFAEGNSGDLFVRKAPASTVSTLISALSILKGNKAIEVKDIGIRHGEKQHESLVSSEEMMKAVDCGDYFRIPLDTRSLDYQIYFNEGTKISDSVEGYTSANTVQLNAEQVAEKIAGLPQFKEMYG